MSATFDASGSSSSRPETIAGMAISLFFWLCLIIACALFGVVSLSPKLLVYFQLRDQFEANQRKLVSLESQAEELQRVIQAIQTDAEFAAELTRIEFDAVRPDEEVIPVDVSLKLDSRVAARQSDGKAFHEWYEPLVKTAAADERLRFGSLAIAGVLVIIAFTMLQPASSEAVANDSRPGAVWKTLRSRYERST
jgi:cell division protein FtsB